jgi:hypothetical protein
VRLIEKEVETVATPAAGFVVRSVWQRRILTFLMVFGPGLIVMEADNDAGAVPVHPSRVFGRDDPHARISRAGSFRSFYKAALNRTIK